MRQRYSYRHALAAAASLTCLVVSGNALAQEPAWREGRWHDKAGEPPRDLPPQQPYAEPMRLPEREEYRSAAMAPLPNPGREAWLADCRQRVSSHDRGLGGAAIGGVVGGVAGNRLAGRGNRTVGTLAGAAVGAAAGAVIDRAEDAGRNRDECEAYLDDYYARYQAPTYGAPHGGYAYAPGYAYGYQQSYAPGYGCCGTPVMMVPAPAAAAKDCVETVEYIYEDVPVPRRSYRTPARRTKVVRDKRVKLSIK